MRIERAEYEAALAERRYQEVDPSQRLVAGTLERRWNDALLQLEDLKKQAAEFQRQEARVATPEQKAKVLALAKDLPRVWHAPTTQAKDRKRMLRLLIKDITVEKPSTPKQLLVHFRWQGRRLDRPLRATPAQHSRSRAVSCCGCRPSPRSGSPLARCRDRGPAQSGRTCQRQRQTVHREGLSSGSVGAIRFLLPTAQEAGGADRPTGGPTLWSQRLRSLLLDRA